MEDFVTGVTVDKYLWALKEDVRVTLIDMDPELVESTFLVERLETWRSTFRHSDPRALVLTFRETMVLINGQYIDLGDDLMSWCGMTDELTMAPSPKIGDSVVIKAED